MKEAVNIEILITSRNGDRKIMQPVRITSEHSTRRRAYIKVIPIRKYLNRLNFDEEPKVHEGQQVKD